MEPILIDRNRSQPQASKELPQGPSPLWLTVVVLLNVLIIAGILYIVFWP